jgi:hypothetical protein
LEYEGYSRLFNLLNFNVLDKGYSRLSNLLNFNVPDEGYYIPYEGKSRITLIKYIKIQKIEKSGITFIRYVITFIRYIKIQKIGKSGIYLMKVIPDFSIF